MAVRIESNAEPLPGYRLLDRLGGGGFGEVWRCIAPGGLHKAIKFVYGNLELAGDDGHRAEQELKALSRVKTVRHPYILSLERFDIIDGQLLIVMELADRNLWDRYKECRAQGLQGIPREELLGYMSEIAEALDLMNIQYQLQHLDIKPQNLFLVYQHVKVADFGLVKDLEGMQASVTGGITPVYAAPETFDGWVSRYSDQYSLAIVYQELLTGQRPFSGTNVRQLILQHLQAQPNLSPLSPAERGVIGRALAKTPEERFPTCRDLTEALRAARVDAPAAPDAARGTVAQAIPGSGDNAHETPSSGIPVGITPSRQASATPLSDSAQGRTQPIRGREAVSTAPEPRLGLAAPSEVHGDGALMPTLVVGLGGMGLTLLQHLREGLCRQFGSLAALPQLRLLQIDTDAEAMRSAALPALKGKALAPSEVMVAPLSRPSHYIKGREGHVGLETWFNPRMLYRIPREQVTTGVRALGRLAFWDHYKLLTHRLQTELEAILDPQALATASRETGLGVRSNRPRVYVLTGLAGGTGSGMFLDLTYLIRWQLRLLGYSQPDVTGVLLVPALEGKGSRQGAARDGARVLAIGNTCAALTELYHYASPQTSFTARYLNREAPITDPEPPFSRTVVVPLPEESDAKGTRETAAMAAQFLARDLASPLGRAADLGRADLVAPVWSERGLHFQTFGLYQLSVPRRELIARTARRLCHRLVSHWMSKDSQPVRPAVEEWVERQWRDQEIGPEHFIRRLQDKCLNALNRSPEAAFSRAIEPVASLEGEGITLDALGEALHLLEELLGKPNEEVVDNPGVLPRTLKQTASKAVAEWSQRLAEMPVRLIEEPAFRLAGSEEFIRRVTARIEKVLNHHEPLGQDLLSRAGEACSQLATLIQGDERARKRVPPAEVATLLRNYAKARFHGLVLGQVSAIYVSLRGHLSDTLREINFCRTRLRELQQLLEEGDPALAAENADPDLPRPRPPRYEPLAGFGRLLYSPGCDSLADAVRQVLAGIDEAALRELDTEIQKVLKRDFTALVHVCLTSAHVTRNVEAAVRRCAESWLDARLDRTDAAAQFLQLYAEPERALAEVSSLYEEAAPELGRLRGCQPSELCVLATPASAAGQQLQVLARRALDTDELTTAVLPDDIVFYREWSNLRLADLEALGPLGREPYNQLLAADNFTPHSRNDVEFLGPATDGR